MKLTDLRKLSIRKNLRIRFILSNGMECVITEQGLAHVPELRRIPDFNLDQELSGAAQFVLEPVAAGTKAPVKSRTVGREEMMSLVDSSPVAIEHEEE